MSKSKTMKPFSLYYTVEKGRLLVHLRGRHKDGTKAVYAIKDTEPYFYAEGIPDPDERIKRVEPDAAQTIDGRVVNRIYTYYPKQVAEVRGQFYETHEADVLYPNRVRYDLGIRNLIQVRQKRATLRPEDVKPTGTPQDYLAPRVLTFDLENAGSIDAENVPAALTACALHDSFTDSYLSLYIGHLRKSEYEELQAIFKKRGWRKVKVLPLQDERSLFSMLHRALHKLEPDIFTGWNVTNFDQKYLARRAELMHYTQYDWRQLEVFDCMDAYARLHEGQLPSKSLQYVSQLEGLGGKTTNEKKKRISELTPVELIEYNLKDVADTVAIDRKRNLIRFFLSLTNYAGCGIGDALLTGRMVDSYLFHRLKGEMVLPTKRKVSEEEKKANKVVGATVFKPSTGLFRNVVEFDNSAEYAAAIQTFNLSPETRVK